MQRNKNMAYEENSIKKPYVVKQKIGKTTYEISVYFNKASTETARDKLKRIIINDYIHKKVS